MKELPLEIVKNAIFEDMVNAEKSITNLIEFFNDSELDGFVYDYKKILDDIKKTKEAFERYYEERSVYNLLEI